MKKILFLAILVFLSCGKKSDDEPTCKENKYQSGCAAYRAADESNIELPAYPGCAAAYKYGVDGKGSGKLSVMASSIYGVDGSRNSMTTSRVTLISEGKVIKDVTDSNAPFLGYQSATFLKNFDIEEGKEYFVRCDQNYAFGDIKTQTHFLPGTNVIKTTLKVGTDSSRAYFGCLLARQEENRVELSFIPNEKVEKVIIKRNGEVISEVKEANASFFSDVTFREVGKEYKYTCDAVVGGQVQLGAYSVTVKKDK